MSVTRGESGVSFLKPGVDIVELKHGERPFLAKKYFYTDLNERYLYIPVMFVLYCRLMHIYSAL